VYSGELVRLSVCLAVFSRISETKTAALQHEVRLTAARPLANNVEYMKFGSWTYDLRGIDLRLDGAEDQNSSARSSYSK